MVITGELYRFLMGKSKGKGREGEGSQYSSEPSLFWGQSTVSTEPEQHLPEFEPSGKAFDYVLVNHLYRV